MAREYSSESSDGDVRNGKDKDNDAGRSRRHDSDSSGSEGEIRTLKRDRREDRSSKDKGRGREKGESLERRRRGSDDEDDSVEDRRKDRRDRRTRVSDDEEDNGEDRRRDKVDSETYRKRSDGEDELEDGKRDRRGRDRGYRRERDGRENNERQRGMRGDDEDGSMEVRRRDRRDRRGKDFDDEDESVEDRRRDKRDRRTRYSDDNEEVEKEDKRRDKIDSERYRKRSDSEDDELKDRKRDRRGWDRGYHGRENNERQQEMRGDDDEVKKSRLRSGDDDDEHMRDDRGDRVRSRRHENGHRRRDSEDVRGDRERWSQRAEEDEDNRDARKKTERRSRRYEEDDDYRDAKKSGRWSQRVEKDEDERDARRKSERHKRSDNRENNERHSDGGSQRTEKGDGKGIGGSKTERQSTLQENNASIDVSNLGRSGGVYIPPFKLARMMKEVQDKSSVEYQRLTWDALRKSINGLVNKVNATNIKNIVLELFSENLIRGRGLFCRSCMKSQMASPGFTDVFAALVAVVNTKFPEVGELLLRRIVLQLKRAYKRNDKPQLLAAVKFIAHLVNQQVAHEIIALELLTVLLENPTDDSVEVAVGFVKECGSILQDLSPKGLHGIFERFRGILHEGEIDKRVQFLIEGLFAIRKAKFQGHPAVRPELDLVELEDQLTHEISLQEDIDPEIALDIFKPDPNFMENEKRYEELKKNIVGEESEDEEGSEAGSEDESDEESDEEDEEQMKIKDETETNLVNLRRTIYLTIMSSVDFEEAGHKLLKIKLEPGQEMELCIMLLECCSQERTYLRYYGLLGQRFCMINKVHQENFEKCFVQQYSMIHRLETNKLRNVAKFFAHLLGTDALPWHVLSYIRLTEDDTTSSSRIFIKILFQELSEHLGIRLLNERLNDPSMVESFESIFPRDNPKNTRFSINFFTSIGLGGITENLREYLKNMPRLIMQQQAAAASESEPDSDNSVSSSTSDSESESDLESDSDSPEGERGRRNRKRRRRN